MGRRYRGIGPAACAMIAVPFRARCCPGGAVHVFGGGKGGRQRADGSAASDVRAPARGRWLVIHSMRHGVTALISLIVLLVVAAAPAPARSAIPARRGIGRHRPNLWAGHRTGRAVLDTWSSSTDANTDETVASARTAHARAGVPEYWIIDVGNFVLEVHRERGCLSLGDEGQSLSQGESEGGSGHDDHRDPRDAEGRERAGVGRSHAHTARCGERAAGLDRHAASDPERRAPQARHHRYVADASRLGGLAQ